MSAVNRSVGGEPEPLRYEGACGDLAPDGVARCVLLAGHYGNHAHAPDRTADWRAWLPDGGGWFAIASGRGDDGAGGGDGRP